jgi:hypothetical protein
LRGGVGNALQQPEKSRGGHRDAYQQNLQSPKLKPPADFRAESAHELLVVKVYASASCHWKFVATLIKGRPQIGIGLALVIHAL